MQAVITTESVVSALGLRGRDGRHHPRAGRDLEYDPQDYLQLTVPILLNKADVVYGSRFLGGSAHRVVYYWYYVGNTFLTMLSNMVTNINLTDMETGYKAFRRSVLEAITLEEDCFGFEPEITAKISKLKVRIYEVGISYYGRT